MSETAFKLDGRSALIIGLSSRISFALGRGLGKVGAAAEINGHSTAGFTQTAGLLRAPGVKVYIRVFHVTQLEAGQAAGDDALLCDARLRCLRPLWPLSRRPLPALMTSFSP